VTLQPHPFALLLPALTDEEYDALKGDITEHGILVPVIVDEDGLVLDGVHRCRISDELGIDPPLSQLGQMSDERKLHLAVGLNMRRRHLDADRRRELVHKLAAEESLSVRKIASITGWSKSTVARDLADNRPDWLRHLDEALTGIERVTDADAAALDGMSREKMIEHAAQLESVLDSLRWIYARLCEVRDRGVPPTCHGTENVA
jgi:ParB-like chromosome segregation protein Spo0J